MLSRARTTHQRNKAFLSWFGRSQVIDRAGNPKIVYHGTTKTFGAFRSKARNPELGFHFGSISQAEWFATYDAQRGTLCGGNIRPVYLRIENPLRMPDVFVRGPETALNALDWLCRERFIGKADATKIRGARSARDAHTRLIGLLEALGYDGIVYENDQEGGTAEINEDSYCTFSPEQIKSVFAVT